MLGLGQSNLNSKRNTLSKIFKSLRIPSLAHGSALIYYLYAENCQNIIDFIF